MNVSSGSQSPEELLGKKGFHANASVCMRACVRVALTSSTLGSGLLMGLDSWLTTDEDFPLML